MRSLPTISRCWLLRLAVALNMFALVSIVTLYHSRFCKESKKLFTCDDITPHTQYGQKGNYIVLYNYFKAEKIFRCDQSITYTTHSDFTFLDNLAPLLERWQGPVSIALYSPGSDFLETFNRILAQRECGNTPLIKQLVTFHLYFHEDHLPNMKIPQDPESIHVNCEKLLKYLDRKGRKRKTYKQLKNLLYPVNIGRNIARDMATTQYVFPCDIELYPSPGLIPKFLEMISRERKFQNSKRKVFVLPVFEVKRTVKRLPSDKRELVELLINKSAVSFHKYTCEYCHRIPKLEEWIKAPVRFELDSFHVGKRYKPHDAWEPFYIGAKNDPFFDERLNWEGRRDKMVQAYVLCLMDYDFHILDNAFLVHKPGIKFPGRESKSDYKPLAKQGYVIRTRVLPEMDRLYGRKPDCVL